MSEDKKHIEEELAKKRPAAGSIPLIEEFQKTYPQKKEHFETLIRELTGKAGEEERLGHARQELAKLEADNKFWNDLLQGAPQEAGADASWAPDLEDVVGRMDAQPERERKTQGEHKPQTESGVLETLDMLRRKIEEDANQITALASVVANIIDELATPYDPAAQREEHTILPLTKTQFLPRRQFVEEEVEMKHAMDEASFETVMQSLQREYAQINGELQEMMANSDRTEQELASSKARFIEVLGRTRQAMEQLLNKQAQTEKENKSLHAENSLLDQQVKTLHAHHTAEIAQLREATNTDLQQQAQKFKKQQDVVVGLIAETQQLSRTSAALQSTLSETQQRAQEADRQVDSIRQEMQSQQELYEQSLARVRMEHEERRAELSGALTQATAEIRKHENMSSRLVDEARQLSEQNDTLQRTLATTQQRVQAAENQVDSMRQEMQSQQALHEQSIARVHMEHEGTKTALRDTKQELERATANIQKHKDINAGLLAETHNLTESNAELQRELTTTKKRAQTAEQQVDVITQQLNSKQEQHKQQIAAVQREHAAALQRVEEKFAQEKHQLSEKIQRTQTALTQEQHAHQQTRTRFEGEQEQILVSMKTLKAEKVNLQQQLQEAQASNEGLQATTRELTNENETLRAQLAHSRQAVSDAENRAKQVQAELEHTKAQAQKSIGGLQSENQRLKEELTNTTHLLQSTQQGNDQLRAEIHLLAQQNGSLEHQAAANQDQIGQQKAANDQLRATNEQLSAQLQQAQVQLRQQGAEINTLKQQTLEDKQTLTTLHTRMQEMQQEQQGAQQANARLQAELRAKTLQMAELEAYNQRLHQLNIENGKAADANIAKRQQAHEAALREANTRTNRAQEQAAQATREVERLRGVQAEQQRLMQTLDMLRGEQKLYQEALGDKDKEIAQLRAQIRESRQRTEEASREAKASAERQARAQAQLQQAQQAEQLANVNSLTQAEQDRQTIENLRTQMAAMQIALSEAQTANRHLQAQQRPAQQPVQQPQPVQAPVPQPAPQPTPRPAGDPYKNFKRPPMS